MSESFQPMFGLANAKDAKDDEDMHPPPAMRLGAMDTSLNSTAHEEDTSNIFPSSSQVLNFLWQPGTRAPEPTLKSPPRITHGGPNLKPPPRSAIRDKPGVLANRDEPQLVSPTMKRKPAASGSQNFIDGQELRRNVAVDRETKRTFVYSLDILQKGLPEFLWLDLPSSKFAAGLCGRHLTNSLVKNIEEDIRFCSKQRALRDADMKVFRQAVKMPFGGRTVIVSFRIRYVRTSTLMHSLVSWNFFGGRTLPHGVLVMIPSFKQQDAFGVLWGHTQGVNPIPERDNEVSRDRIDAWIRKIAGIHGKYAGDFPRSMSAKKKAANVTTAYSYNEFGKLVKTGKLVACTVEGENIFPSRSKTFTHEV